MDEDLSWRAKLAKANINILGVTITREPQALLTTGAPDPNSYREVARWYYEFMYHPAPHSTKWSKTFFCPTQETTPPGTDPFSFDQIAPLIERQVATLRRELEDTDDNGGKR